MLANLNKAEILIWLNKNLNSNNSILASSRELHSIPEKRGIYFWFMNPKGYSELSNFTPIKALSSVYQLQINEALFDLVYIGTAGARNNKSGSNNGNLFQRLKWHITDNQGVSSLCNGTMSTFRRTLGTLLANDLIENDIQNRLTEFLCKYFHVYYLEYYGDFKNIQDQIEKDEKILIETLNPIFNLSKNPKANQPGTVTYSISKRRQLIEKKSKEIWCGIETTSNSRITTPPEKNTAKNNSSDKCIEFKVKRNENLALKASQISELPLGPCTIELYYDNRSDVRKYINGNIRKIITYNRSVSDFFNAPDPAAANKPKWQIVQEEMNEMGRMIEEITVRVCGSGNNDVKPNNDESKKMKHPLQIPQGLKFITRKKGTPLLLIINCCDAKSKQPDDLHNEHHENYDFGLSIDTARNLKLMKYENLNNKHFAGKKRNGQNVTKDYFLSAMNSANRRPAIEVYGSNMSKFFNPRMKALYQQAIQTKDVHILIVSGLYGIIRFDDYINDYHLPIDLGENVWGDEISNAIVQYASENKIPNDHIFYSLSGTYRPYLTYINPSWTNLWLEYGRDGGQGGKQADDLANFLNNL